MNAATRRAATLAALVLSSSLSAGEYNAVVDIGDRMPGFGPLPTADGGTLSSSELDSDVLVLVSLANHCPWSRGTERDLMRTIRRFERDRLSVEVVGFSVSRREADRLAAMRERAESRSYNFRYVFDESQRLGRALGAARTPEYFVYDAGRRLVYTGLLHDSPALERRGKLRYPNGEPLVFYVDDAVRAAVAARRPKTAETRPHGCSVSYEG